MNWKKLPLAQQVAKNTEDISTLNSNFSTKYIPPNSDLNNYTVPGNYGIQTSSAGATIVNNPTHNAFLLEVRMLQSAITGPWLTGIQRVTSFTGNEVYIRRISTGESGDWVYSTWYKYTGTTVS